MDNANVNPLPAIVDLDIKKAEEAVKAAEQMKVAIVGASISARELRFALEHLEIAMVEQIGETLQEAVNNKPKLKLFQRIQLPPDWAICLDAFEPAQKGHKRNGKQKRNPDRWR